MLSQALITKAIFVAKKSNVDRAKVGAILFTKRGHIVASACNKRFESVIGSAKFTIHAEESLIAKGFRIKAAERFDSLNILVVRWLKGEQILGMAKPCRKCQKILQIAKIKSIFYSDKNGCIKQK